MLALGVKPVGEREFLGGYKYQRAAVGAGGAGRHQQATSAARRSTSRSVAAQRPDVIIGVNSGMTKADYNRLSPDRADGRPERRVHRLRRAVAGADADDRQGARPRGEQAQELVDDVEAQFAKAREEHPEFDTTFTMAYGGDGQLGAHASGDYRVGFFKDLGMKMNPEIDKLAGDAFYIDLDPEQFRLIDQDVVLMFGKRDKVAKDKVLGRLPAVNDGRTIYVDLTDQFAGALGYASPLSLPYLIDEAIPQLVAAADGDPSTTEPDPE